MTDQSVNLVQHVASTASPEIDDTPREAAQTRRSGGEGIGRRCRRRAQNAQR
jgi:hypothetical protein